MEKHSKVFGLAFWPTYALNRPQTFKAIFGKGLPRIIASEFGENPFNSLLEDAFFKYFYNTCIILLNKKGNKSVAGYDPKSVSKNFIVNLFLKIGDRMNSI